MRLTDITQIWLQDTLQQGDSVIDATLGNGFDALFLARCIGPSGHLYGFDVQAQAIRQSRALLADQACLKSFFLQGHEQMASVLPKELLGQVKGIMFNLGWLPGSDKSIITLASTTIAALEQSLTFLADGGKLSVMVYPGHQGGDTEAAQVMQWLEQVCLASDGGLRFEKVVAQGRPSAPILLKVEKLSA